MQLQIKSLFNQEAGWKDIPTQKLRDLAKPKDAAKEAEMIDCLKAGGFVLSVMGTFKFRMKPSDIRREQ